jgi:ankyrin repeat protein
LAQIYLNSLSDKVTAKAVRYALQDFQKQISGSSEQKKTEVLTLAYKGAMDRINGQMQGFKDLAIQILSWITCAKRQMTTTELQEALAVEVGNTELDRGNFPQLQDMITVCAGLVTVDEESNIIRLVHYTTQEYFEQTWTSWFPNAQEDITNICVTYLLFDVFEAGICQSSEDLEARLQRCVLYSYAANYWGHHATTGPIEKDLVLELLESRTKVSAASQAMMASENNAPYSTDIPRNMTGAHVAAYFGLEVAMLYLLNSGSDPDKVDVNSKDSHGRTPLWWALERGHGAVVKLLLETGKVDVESKDSHRQTPLSWAASHGHEVIVKLLLEAGKVDVDSKDVYGQTPLSGAVEGGHKAVVQLLLKTGKVDVDLKDRYGRTMLSWAASRGNEAIARLLLETGKVDVDSKDNLGRTPLLWAAYLGHEAVVKLLLETGKVDVDLKDNIGRTPLSRGAYLGHEAVVKLLLETGKVDVESKDNIGRTPLQTAAVGGHEAVVMLLQSYCKTS